MIKYHSQYKQLLSNAADLEQRLRNLPRLTPKEVRDRFIRELGELKMEIAAYRSARFSVIQGDKK